MPMRAYRASRDAVRTSTGHAASHLVENKLAWMAVSAAVAAVAFYLNWNTPGREPSIWGHVGAIAGMLLGILIMMKAQEGHVPPDDGPDEG
jgi:hypothetical protein